MGIPSIGAGSIGTQFGGAAGGGSRESIESKLTQLEKQRDEYEKKLAYEPSLKSKIDSLNNRIENLKTRLDKAKQDDGECQTCKNRKYVDGSNEGDVSFKSPTHVSPANSVGAVMGHEQEHVANAIAEGNKEGKELVSVSVNIRMARCPECGTVYAEGGTTNSVIKSYKGDYKDNPYDQNRKIREGDRMAGSIVDSNV